MWPFSRIRKISEKNSGCLTDAVMSSALMGNRDAWETIFNYKSYSLLREISDLITSCVIIHRWGDESEKNDCLATSQFVDFVISQHASKRNLPNISDDDKIWQVTQIIIKNCIELMAGTSPLPGELREFIDEANALPAIHEEPFLSDRLGPVSNLTQKAQEITARLSQ